MFTSTSTSTNPIDVFNFEAIRLSPDFERQAGVRKQLTHIPVRKPEDRMDSRTPRSGLPR